MKKILFCFSLGVFLLSCNNGADKAATPAADKPAEATAATADKAPAGLAYTASYSSTWSTDVSDADLKMVLTSYKDWETGNMAGVQNAFTDTVMVEMNNGDHLVKSKADLVKMWTTFRDSLSNVRIDMEGWHKMYSTDKKEGYIVTWYKEYDTYKSGQVDSANYHDINQLKNGKISWYSQYKRKMK